MRYKEPQNKVVDNQVQTDFDVQREESPSFAKADSQLQSDKKRELDTDAKNRLGSELNKRMALKFKHGDFE